MIADAARARQPVHPTVAVAGAVITGVPDCGEATTPVIVSVSAGSAAE
jgi:hypothetical protein